MSRPLIRLDGQLSDIPNATTLEAPYDLQVGNNFRFGLAGQDVSGISDDPSGGLGTLLATQKAVTDGIASIPAMWTRTAGAPSYLNPAISTDHLGTTLAPIVKIYATDIDIGNDLLVAGQINGGTLAVDSLFNVFYGDDNAHENGTITTGDGNVAMGSSAGRILTSASQNVFIGVASGANATSGDTTVAVGGFTAYGGAGNYTARNNVFVGYGAGYAVTTANNSTITGAFAGTALIGGSENSLYGYAAGGDITSGSSNSIFGSYAGRDMTGARFNSFFGAAAGRDMTGDSNVVIGHESGLGWQAGTGNILVGRRTGDQGDSGDYNILIGYDVQKPGVNDSNRLNIGDTIFGNTGTSWIGIGADAPISTEAFTVAGAVNISANCAALTYNGAYVKSWDTGDGIAISIGDATTDAAGSDGQSVRIGSSLAATGMYRGQVIGHDIELSADQGIAIGYSLGNSGSLTDSELISSRGGCGAMAGSPYRCTFMGFNVNYIATAGADYSQLIGGYAGERLTGEYVTGIGYSVFSGMTTGAYNVGMGRDAGDSIVSSDNGTFIGARSGRYYGAGTSPLSTAADSTYVGYDARAGFDFVANETVIGANAIGNGSNTMTLGNAAVTDNFLQGNYHVETDHYIYLHGDESTDGSVRFSYQTLTSKIQMEVRIAAVWTAKHSFSMT